MRPSFLDEAFFSGLGSSNLPIEDAESLPPLCYTDSGFYDFEKEALFNHEWLCVGRESWLAKPGDYFTTSIINEPLIVCRDTEGRLRAMSAVCQHRAMLVAEGRGNARGFLCPYHHWAYGLDGSLVSAPAMNQTRNFDKSSISLPALAVEVWLGFIFVNFDRKAAPLGPRLKAVEEAIARYDLGDTEDVGEVQTRKFPWSSRTTTTAITPTACITGPCTISCPATCVHFRNCRPIRRAICATTARCIRTRASIRPRRPCCRCFHG